MAQIAHGDRVVILWLTRGEMTEAFGPLELKEVARRRVELGHRAGDLLGAETRFLDFADTRLEVTPEATLRVARAIADIRPDGLITWGDAWTRGKRHPDHQACGKIFRDAVTVARMAKAISPLPPHREPVPVFTVRDIHSTLPAVVLDVEPYRDAIHRLGRLYYDALGFGEPAWLDDLLATNGRPFGLRYAEVLDAWETEGGRAATLLPPPKPAFAVHPERPAALSATAAEAEPT